MSQIGTFGSSAETHGTTAGQNGCIETIGQCPLVTIGKWVWDAKGRSRTPERQRRGGSLSYSVRIPSEFQTRVQRNHARAAVSAQTDAEQARGRRGGIGESAKSGLGRRFAGDSSQHDAGQREIGMVEYVEKLGFDS